MYEVVRYLIIALFSHRVSLHQLLQVVLQAEEAHLSESSDGGGGLVLRVKVDLDGEPLSDRSVLRE